MQHVAVHSTLRSCLRLAHVSPTSIPLLHPCTAVAAYKTRLSPMRHSPCVESFVVTGFVRYVPMAVYTLLPLSMELAVVHGMARGRSYGCVTPGCAGGVAKVVINWCRAAASQASLGAKRKAVRSSIWL